MACVKKDISEVYNRISMDKIEQTANKPEHKRVCVKKHDWQK